ncbi:MAG TPA: EF-hand domain-containing protein [Burkholderiales bacterium]|nr:EF-hand domain-containing protein [Burkholderiales bacterium]
MKLLHSFVAASAVVALSFGSAMAAGNAKQDQDPGFNALDKNHDGSISKTEAQGNPDLAKRFSTADTDHDGKLSRVEYLKVMAKEDFNSVKEKVGNLFDKKDNSSSAGGTRSGK